MAEVTPAKDHAGDVPANGRLGGRSALVTGSTRGIGLAIAEQLLDCGAKVIVNGRSAEQTAAVAERLGDRALPMAADVSDPTGCRTLVERSVEALGRLDILVNNAGTGIFKPFGDLSEEDWRAQIDLNLGGVFHCSRAALPHLVASGDGHIVNIGSLAGRNAFAGGAGYNASKFGLVGLTEAMMLDVRYDGVRVSMVMPGSVATEFGGRSPETGLDWRLWSEDCAAAVLHIVTYPERAHASRIEIRPSQPRRS